MIKTTLTSVIIVLLLCGLSTCSKQKKTFNESFVEVSSENPSYFCLSNGDTYIPIGLNVCHIRNDMDEMERWFKNLSENGGNFARIWLGFNTFDYETVYGQVDEEKIARVDTIIALAKKYGIKLKMCIENFRVIAPEYMGPHSKKAYHISNGGPFTSMTDYMSDDRGQKVFLDRVKFFKARYGDDPCIFAWELWNEMNAIGIDNRADVIPWSAAMLKKVKEIFPENLATQSLGSMDRASVFPHHEALMRIPENEVIQVHRYIDEGAELPVCQAPMDVLAADAIETMQSYGTRKPILLAETGAVQPVHTGPHRAYANDPEGTILHDLLFAPYFTGAAGPGHSWHWDNYVDQNNIWFQFRRFSNAIEGVDPVKEGFHPLRADQPGFRVYVLKGKNHSLVWVRDAENTWKTELIDRIKPKLHRNITLNLNDLFKDVNVTHIKCYDPWTDQWSDAKTVVPVVLPDFRRSLTLKIGH